MARPYVILWKDGGDGMGVETNVIDPEAFIIEFSKAIAQIAELEKFKGDLEFQLSHWIPNAFDIVAKLKGYKAEVEEIRILRSGYGNYSKEDVVVNTEEIPEKIDE